MAQSHSFAEIVGLEALQADLLAEKGSYEELVEEKLKDVIPTWHCSSTNNSTACNSNFDICKLFKSEWAWDENPSKTIVSEWDLQCSNALLRGLPAYLF
ncbi:hypothetical protein JRO89_XS14G0046600 [Xanthoceras sorbifolium]|uniref:Uncharacterized protein n=1 Tax=Xanthoceras sorbifolium TaxID=99658 RepID=A0ABQ8H3V8_9ROSI|nr:hypothetical protein JRO89_XS14G0046600 [Xanthoceras sorbifolium]